MTLLDPYNREKDGGRKGGRKRGREITENGMDIINLKFYPQ